MKMEEEEEIEKMKIMEKEEEALGEKEEERVGVGMEARERGRDSVEQHPFTNLVFTTAPNNIKFPADVSHALYDIESEAKVQQTNLKSRSSLLTSD